jgi:hypothetical protein
VDDDITKPRGIQQPPVFVRVALLGTKEHQPMRIEEGSVQVDVVARGSTRSTIQSRAPGAIAWWQVRRIVNASFSGH